MRIVLGGKQRDVGSLQVQVMSSLRAGRIVGVCGGRCGGDTP